MKIENVKVYGLNNSIRVSKFPHHADIKNCDYKATQTVKALGSAEAGSGHDQFLTGIVVQFDLKCTIKMWTELQRYHFIDFISSQSTMHNITKFSINANTIDYVLGSTIDIVEKLRDEYMQDQTQENFLYLIYNVPVGFELTAGMTTNYRQLKTIYHQRKNHRLPEWREFCKWIETLPRFKEFCLNNK